MKQVLSMALCFLLLGALPLRAEDTTATSTPPTSNVVSTTDVEGLKSEVAGDKAKIAEEKNQIKEHAKAAHVEEKALRQQIRDANLARDTKKVEELRAQLKTMHQENVGQMKQDKKELGAAKKELRTDRKEVVKGRADRNKDGKVDATEKKQAKKRGWWGW